MDYAEFSSDLPAERISFFSAEENEEVMQAMGVNQIVRHLGKGGFRADLAAWGTKDADFFAERFSHAFSIYLEPPADTVGVRFFRSATGEFLASGEEVANERLVVMPPGSGADLVAPDLSGSDALTIPVSRYAELSEALIPDLALPESLTVLDGDTNALRAIRNDIVRLIADPAADSTGGSAAVLVERVITWIGHAPTQAAELTIRPSVLRAKIAKTARDYIEAHYRDGIRVEDVCRAVGVGVRTLQRSFREYFGLTVSGYLKTVRFNSVHRQLLTGDPSENTVTEILLGHGVTHLGRFSVEFRQRFGKCPSDVLAARNKGAIKFDALSRWPSGGRTTRSEGVAI